VALTNAQFPMLWPTPYAATGVVDLSRSRLELPVVPRESAFPRPVLPAPHPRPAREDVTWLADTSVGPLVTRDSAAGTTVVRWLTVNARKQGEARFAAREEYRYEVRDADPASASWEGSAMHQIDVDRTILVETRFSVRGTVDAFDVTVSRRLTMNGRMIREKEWVERISATLALSPIRALESQRHAHPVAITLVAPHLRRHGEERPPVLATPDARLPRGAIDRRRDRCAPPPVRPPAGRTCPAPVRRCQPPLPG
jgi:hypothetical protein